MIGFVVQAGVTYYNREQAKEQCVLVVCGVRLSTAIRMMSLLSVAEGGAAVLLRTASSSTGQHSAAQRFPYQRAGPLWVEPRLLAIIAWNFSTLRLKLGHDIDREFEPREEIRYLCFNLRT